MAQVGIDGFDRGSLALVVHRGMSAPVTQLAVHQRGIREVTRRWWRAVNDTLQDFGCALPDYVVRDDASSGSIYGRDNVGLRFFEPTKVNNSSSSTTSGAVTDGSEIGRAACLRVDPVNDRLVIDT